MTAAPTRIVVLVSGSGSNLQVLLDHGLEGRGEIVGVVSDRPGVRGLERARAAGVEARVVAPADDPDRAAWDARLHGVLEEFAPDLVVLAGFMRILAPATVTRWPMINVHPALLPAFPGAHGVRDALAWGAKVTGCTVHVVDEQVDHGPILAQGVVDVRPDDDEASLHRRIQTLEHTLLPEVVTAWCAGRVELAGRVATIRPE